MYKMQQVLLVFFLCMSPTLLFAQVDITVEINGIEKKLEDNVRLYLSIEQQKSHTLMTEGRLRRLYKKAPQEIANALQPFGYYRPVIKSVLKQASPERWVVTFDVNPGPPLRIGHTSVNISGEIVEDPEVQALIQKSPLGKGEIFNHLDYEKFKTSLVKLAAEQGYFSARFTEHLVEVDLEVYEARIQLQYDSGRRYLFGEVNFSQDVLKPGLLQRFIPFKKNSPYMLSKVLDFQQGLNDSQYFQSVEVSPGQPQPDSASIPINVKLTPRKKNRYLFGIGYGTDTGVRAKLGWEKPLLNSSGHRFSSEAKLSEIGYSVSAHYRVPVLNPRTDQIVYSTGVVNEKTDVSDSTVRTVGVSLNRSRGLWRESASISYQDETYVVADDVGTSTLLIPGVNWSRTWGKEFIYAVDGLRFDIGIRGASDKLVSDISFLQLQGGIKAINSLGRSNRIITHGRLGGTSTQEFDRLPSSVRFFAGGSQSVRGYSYHSLGPVDSSGKVVGGKHLMVGSIEFEHNLGNEWGLALFYDAGNAIDDMNDRLERGAGVGLRWQSPVGPVRIDVASAISREDNPWRLHITIGPDL